MLGFTQQAQSKVNGFQTGKLIVSSEITDPNLYNHRLHGLLTPQNSGCQNTFNIEYRTYWGGGNSFPNANREYPEIHCLFRPICILSFSTLKVKDSMFLKNGHFIIQERFNKLIYGVNTITRRNI